MNLERVTIAGLARACLWPELYANLKLLGLLGWGLIVMVVVMVVT